MSIISIILTVLINTILVMILGTTWYSQKYGLGSLLAKAYWGSLNNYNTNCKPKLNMEKTNMVTWTSAILINTFLIFLINYVYAPQNYTEICSMSLVLTVFHFITELPHIGYELRSYSALMIHAGFHFVMFALSLASTKYMFNIPKAGIAF